MCQRLVIIVCAFFIVLVLFGCKSTGPKEQETLFTSLNSSYTGIDFTNELTYDKDFNIYTYRNFYNGGGVAIGDVNNDGLPDVFFYGQYAA